MKEAAEKYTFKRSELPGQIKYMAEMRTQMERTLAEGQLDPAGTSSAATLTPHCRATP